MDHPDVLPVIDPSDGATAAAQRDLAAPPDKVVRTGRLARLRTGGNTKASEAPLARQEVTRAAMKGGDVDAGDGQDWREQLHQGQRGKAAGVISAKRNTHNSSSGFGAARPGYSPY